MWLMNKIVWIAILIAYARGVFVLDSEYDAVASAICLIGAIFATILMLKWGRPAEHDG